MITIDAPAKVNLFLHVTGRKPDGYHTLDTLVVFAGAGDRVTLARSPTLELSVEGPFAAALAGEHDNLVLRAARRLADAAGSLPRVSITLTKRLPVAAGLGGGASDAAAVLKGLASLWGITVPPTRLAAIALELGADVPACLFGKPVSVSGIGESLTPAPRLPEAWLLLVTPGVLLPTFSVFRNFSGPFSTPNPLERDQPIPDAEALAQALKSRRNDLTETAIAQESVIGNVLSVIEAQPGCLLARMSGSGSTCFGLFAQGEQAHAASKAISQDHPGWWSTAAPLLHEAPRPLDAMSETS